jgi:hypothetical protein
VSGWLALGMFVIALIAVALIILALDVARGDVGGGRHTMERARRLLVVSTDEETARGAETWMDRQLVEHPRMQCFVLTGADDQESYLDIQEAIEQHRPDAVVVARHQQDSHTSLDGLYGRLKEDLHIPVDAIYVEGGPSA